MESLPPGYRIERGGAIEESEKANVAYSKNVPAVDLGDVDPFDVACSELQKSVFWFLVSHRWDDRGG